MLEAPILVLDDALSSVDNQTATEILNLLTQKAGSQTILFISHQLSAAAIADRIFVMDRGRIVQIGSHEELIQTEGLYQYLWQQQLLEKTLQT
jgi:ATP-binding cassette subfamily B protein